MPGNAGGPDTQLPVIIKYIGYHKPDDSIQQYIKTYLKLKKIMIINDKQGFDLMLDQAQRTMEQWIKSGKLKDVKSEQDPKMEEMRNDMLKPVYYLFRLKFFSSEVNTQYQIDSVHWQLLSVPDRDTSFISNRFLPVSVNNQNIYFEIKELLEQVVKSIKI